MAIIKGAPFRFKGSVDVSNCETAEEVINQAQLNWIVKKCPVVAKMIPSLHESKDDGFINDNMYYRDLNHVYATYRSDVNIPLGIVKDKYEPVQNIDAFKFFNDAIGIDKAIWQTAGYFGQGERIFVSAKLPNIIDVGNDDIVENYLVFTTSHDGSSGVKILFTPIRVVCENTLNAAIKGSSNIVSFRHTASVHDNIQLISQILASCNNISVNLGEKFKEMKSIKVNDIQSQYYFAKNVLTDDELGKLKVNGYTPFDIITRNYHAMEAANISTRKTNVLAEMWNYYHSGPGQREIMGTAWGLYNTITGYYSNVDNIEGAKRMDSILYGDKSRKIMVAGDMALNLKAAA